MRILYYLSIFFLFTAFLCESDDTLVSDESIAFPEAASGELAIEIEGSVRIISGPFLVGRYKADECFDEEVSFSRVLLAGLLDNPDGSRVSVWLRQYNADVGLFENTLDETTYACESSPGINSQIRLSLSYYEPDATSATESYRSDPDIGGLGNLEVTEFLVPECCYSPMDPDPGDDLDGYVSGNFNFTLIRVTPDDPDADPLEIRGAFNRVPLKYFYDIPYYF
ncbi:hypothetical protein [Gilvibacter sediminis]|uniref:hypothetical protein n=1 Tax=Gilvibacter sediminis TaxID=379071 RepID=UPI002350A657|nr:hypothetical protein [Gilvibacter sediminis]MDC7998893.1 hypothetical protein [Gilvibacter sediminis]